MKALEPKEDSLENPLVPHSLLRQMYRSMLQARMLDELTRRKLREAKIRAIGGMEAPLAAVLLSLREGDVVLDATDHPAIGYLLGADLDSVLRHTGAAGKDSKQTGIGLTSHRARILPYTEDAAARLLMGLGAAAGAKAAASQRATVLFVLHREIKKGAWKFALAYAAQHELPVFFVVLPKSREDSHKGSNQIRTLAQKAALPGIPVDSSDSIALYRVAQEALGRIRAGDGPVLMECIGYKLPEASGQDQGDAVARLQKYLMDRAVVDAKWIAGIEQEFAASLKQAARIRQNSRSKR